MVGNFLSAANVCLFKLTSKSFRCIHEYQRRDVLTKEYQSDQSFVRMKRFCKCAQNAPNEDFDQTALCSLAKVLFLTLRFIQLITTVPCL